MREAFATVRRRPALWVMVALAGVVTAGSALAGEPFKLGVEEQGYLDNAYQGGASYPAPRMIPQQGRAGAYQGGARTTAPLQGSARASAPLQGGAQAMQRPPIQATVTQRVVLPPSLLGVWHVIGQRQKVEAATPDFEQTAYTAFAVNTDNTWEISGDPNSGYQMGSNTGIKTPLIVDKVQGGTAFVRYQHPIGKTMAQEAIVLSLLPGGAQFNGLERVSIVKQGEPPRARVTYQLVGQRQR